MKWQLVGAIARNEARHCNHTAISLGKSRTLPHIVIQHITTNFRELWSDVTEMFLRSSMFGRHIYIPFSRSEEHTSELQSLMRISYAVFCLKKTTLHHMSTHIL